MEHYTQSKPVALAAVVTQIQLVLVLILLGLAVVAQIQLVLVLILLGLSLEHLESHNLAGA